MPQPTPPSLAGSALQLLEDSPAALLADVPPTWRQQQDHAQQHQNNSKAIGTEPLQLRDAGAQTTDRCDAGCQATTSSSSGRASSSAGQRSRAEPHMPAFLQAVAPSMLAALSANSEAAAGWPQAGPRSQTLTMQEGSARCLFTLTAFSSSSSSRADNNTNTSSSKGAAGGGGSNPHKLQVTSLSWSKTGQTLAASFGRYDISGWCCTPGAIATWNLARLGAAGSSNSGSSSSGSSGRPDRLIDADTCVMCCAFHPAEPALLAGGTFNGELVIWDLSREDANAQVAKSDVLSELRHREPITALSWQHSAQEVRRRGASAAAAAYRLFTLGADGRLLVWLWDQTSNPIFGYELRVAQPGQDPRACLGGSCMAFCPAASAHEEAAMLLVGTEGGQLLRCQVGDISESSLKDFSARLAAAAAAPPGSTGSKLELRSAVVAQGAAAKHNTPCGASVNALSACPHHRQLALAASGDGTLRVLDVLRSDPLLLLEPSAGGLMAAAWSPSRPLVFAAASASCVYLYDLSVRQRIIRPVLQLPVVPDAAGAAAAPATATAAATGVNALAFNAQVPSMLAAAAGGAVSVWTLPQRLVEPRSGEVKLLRRMLDSEDACALLRVQGIVQ